MATHNISITVYAINSSITSKSKYLIDGRINYNLIRKVRMEVQVIAF